ncbi:MAG: hypothetical protein BWX80_03031 [Candidatus Hydrogenedentes bacterium ADurb.Bin101]|nr:MAG: hypothetical protein BWX80_03031 [Candidatus Hydrogenedentes bacterium ADurb.Bin101]
MRRIIARPSGIDGQTNCPKILSEAVAGAAPHCSANTWFGVMTRSQGSPRDWAERKFAFFRCHKVLPSSMWFCPEKRSVQSAVSYQSA